jgi:hypothetical protein
MFVILGILGSLIHVAEIYKYFTPPSHTRDLVTAAIIAAPFLVPFGRFLGVLSLSVAFKVLWLLPGVFHALLLWRCVLRPPRFRSPKPFALTQLCGDCKENLSRSGLLFGSRVFLTKANE